jgi:hypothetical protein
MRLFHVSEDGNINIFKPRKPSRIDMQKSHSLVWAINEKCLPNFLTPRYCPRITYYAEDTTTDLDKQKYFSSIQTAHVIAIEQDWFERMLNNTLYIYEFDMTEFLKKCFDDTKWQEESNGLLMMLDNSKSYVIFASSDNSLYPPYIKFYTKALPSVFVPQENINPPIN